MTNEIVVTFKGKTGQDPWIVVHSDPQTINQALESITAELIAKVHSTQEHFNAGPALAQLVPQPTAAAEPSVWAQSPPPTGPNVVPAPAEQAPPVQQPVQPQAAPAQGDIPGVSIWTGPNPAKPQYEATFFSVPFIADKAQRDAFNKALKDGAWAKPHDTGVKPWVYIAPKGGTEQFVRDTIAAYAHAFQG